MPQIEEVGSTRVADTLRFLAGQRERAREIDQAFIDYPSLAHKLVMTSIGNSRRAVVTPAYPGITLANCLSDRISYARTYKRPFIEAGVHFSRSRQLASVTLRLCMVPTHLPVVMETGWSYDLGADAQEVSTLEDVVDIVSANFDGGQPLAARSGEVVANPQRLATTNWAISRPLDPVQAAMHIHANATSPGLHYVTDL